MYTPTQVPYLRFISCCKGDVGENASLPVSSVNASGARRACRPTTSAFMPNTPSQLLRECERHFRTLSAKFLATSDSLSVAAGKVEAKYTVLQPRDSMINHAIAQLWLQPHQATSPAPI